METLNKLTQKLKRNIVLHFGRVIFNFYRYIQLIFYFQWSWWSISSPWNQFMDQRQMLYKYTYYCIILYGISTQTSINKRCKLSRKKNLLLPNQFLLIFLTVELCRYFIEFRSYESPTNESGVDGQIRLIFFLKILDNLSEKWQLFCCHFAYKYNKIYHIFQYNNTNTHSCQII